PPGWLRARAGRRDGPRTSRRCSRRWSDADVDESDAQSAGGRSWWSAWVSSFDDYLGAERSFAPPPARHRGGRATGQRTQGGAPTFPKTPKKKERGWEDASALPPRIAWPQGAVAGGMPKACSSSSIDVT